MNELIKKDQPTEIIESETASIIRIIERVAMDPSADIDKMERLMAMKERMDAKAAETDFNKAMNLAQSEMGRILVDATNPQTRSKYASYAALDKMLRPIYTKHGFSLSFDTDNSAHELFIKVLCMVSHTGGHSRIYHVDMPADGKGAKGGDVMTKTHAAGSAMSYGMRYLLRLIFNAVVGEDDDGNAASFEYITEEQAANIEALIEEVRADKAKFLKYMKAQDVEHIQKAAYQDAVKALQKKRAK